MIKHVLEMPVYREVDVAVVGGGPGGVAAALAAAKNGAKTLLVERYYALVAGVGPQPAWIPVGQQLQQQKASHLGLGQPLGGKDAYHHGHL